MANILDEIARNVEALELLEITIDETHSPFAVGHNYPCPVCQVRPAVYNINTARFNVCWTCQGEGWRVCKPKLIGKGEEA